MQTIRTLGKGQVVLPKAVRERLGISVGSRLLLRVEGGKIVLKPLPKDPIQALHGILKHDGPSTKDLLKWRTEERAREARKSA